MRNSLYKVCVIAVFCFSAGSAPVTADDLARGLLLQTLDNLEKVTAANPWMSPDIQFQIEEVRQQLGVSTSAETEAMPAAVYNRLLLLETSTKQLALLYDPALRAQSAQAQEEGARRLASPTFSAQAFQEYESDALEAPAYPEISWYFGWDNVSIPDFLNGTNAGFGEGLCVAPGYDVDTRFAALSAAVALEAVRDIASRLCSQSVVGSNGSIACIVTDIAKNVASGINTFQEMCNAYMTAAEVSATWNGLNTVHGNVQHVYEGIGDVKELLDQVLQNQTHAQGDLQTVIQLLNTPQGIRPTWPADRKSVV